MATQASRWWANMARHVSEARREDEMLGYAQTLSSAARLNSLTEPVPSSELSTCSDAVLTGLCQLGAWQTGTARAFLSLLGARHQYIVAEAMPSLPLQPSLPSDDCPAPLWFCGTAVPRPWGVCEDTVVGASPDPEPAAGANFGLAVTVYNDLDADARFDNDAYRRLGGQGSFCAAVPIRTRRGIDIGAYWVVDEKPGRPWDDSCSAHLRHVSAAIMDHLESQRLNHLHRRNERMNRGLGSFIEGETTLSGWRSGPNAAAYVDEEDLEGALNPKQQLLGLLPFQQSSPGEGITPQTPMSEADAGDTYFAPKTDPMPERRDRTKIYSRAANIIRESLEVEGCVFYRPSPSLRIQQDSQSGDQTLARGDTSSSASGGEASRQPDVVRSCHALGFSNSELSSVDSAHYMLSSTSMTEHFLASLLRRYPQGATFNFTAQGELLSSDLSGDEIVPRLAADALLARTNSTQDANPTPSPSSPPPPASDEQQQAASKRRRPRRQEGEALREAFPDARGIVFAPVWDSRKDGWYAGVFAYTHRQDRAFTAQADLSYLRVFGAVVASEIQRLDSISANQAKADALGSLSHELRSPLHGVLLSAELMRDTDMDVYQGNLAHTIETCSRTMLDTIDHLLDYSQINNFSKPGRRSGSASASGVSRAEKGQYGKKLLFSYTRLDGLVEEVVESVFAGFNFQYQSLKQTSREIVASDVAAHQRLDSAQALEQLPGRSGRDGTGELLSFGQVSVLLSIDSRCRWEYHAHVGAVRRIIMNLFGNALKYTSAGTITVSLSQETMLIRRRKRHVVKITVQDTGKGMSASFLETGLFRPFSQEDSMSPGTGLGLSLVKKITTQLHGQISIDSQLGVGTSASVVLPLDRAELPADTQASQSREDTQFEDFVKDLRGLRVRIVTTNETGVDTPSAADGSLHDICCNWLHMEVLTPQMSASAVPDIVLWSYDASVQIQGAVDEVAKFPNVVICPDAFLAYRRNAESTLSDQRKVTEFVSQPIGPRKLAKVLVLAYRRWVESSYNSSQESLATAPAVARPKVEKEISLPSVVPSLDSLTLTSQITGPGDSTSVNNSAPDSSVDHGHQPNEAEGVKRCLLVDDNDINIKVLSALMRKLGVDYKTASNGREAVNTFKGKPGAYACILMDISMPIMDGFEATRLIRAFEVKEHLQAVPIIALSGLSSNEAHQEAFESGMDMFLTKPVKLLTLKELLQSNGIF